METNHGKITITSHGGRENDRNVSIDHLNDKEYEETLGSINGGMWWVRVVDGRLESFPNYERLPAPMEDKEMLPFWRKANTEEMKTTYALFEMEPIEELNNSFASITIQSLCGYCYSPKNYQIEAEKLTSYGFECLRSRRDDDAKFWEVWFLPSILFAKGELKDHIALVEKEKLKLKSSLEFLRVNVKFGSLDVSVQRIAMCAPE